MWKKDTWTLETLSAALNKSRDAETFCRKNLENLGGGAYRSVYKVVLEDGTTVAVKVGSSWANSREVERYKEWKSPEMAAILSYDERQKAGICQWVIMEFVPNILSRMDSNKYMNWWHVKEAVLDKLKQFIQDHEIGDAHSANVGFRADGTACIVDYAG